MEQRLNWAVFFLILWTILRFITCIPQLEDAKDCVFTVGNNRTYNLKILRKWSPWNLTTNRNGKLIHYKISLCDPLQSEVDNDPCAGGSVCQIDGTQRTLLAVYSQNFSTKSYEEGYDWLVMNGPLLQNSQSDKRTIEIEMQCGSHLGHPTLLFEFHSKSLFSWKSAAFCYNRINKVSEDVPCSTHDTSGRFYDLLPLLKTVGGYKVETQNPSQELYINVCTNIVPDGQTSGCPAGSPACWKVGNRYISAGQLRTPLARNSDDQLLLTYESSELVDGCQRAPKTVIKFVCPQNGESSKPRLIVEDNCLYEVYWETDYACPDSIHRGNISLCGFQSQQHGIDIDLSTLRRPRENPYNVSAVIDGERQNFLLNVCGGIGELNCQGSAWKSTSVCLVQSGNNMLNLGMIKSAELRYAEKKLSLTYTAAARGCPGYSNDTQAQTVINFICDESTGGSSEPQFVSREECTYFFEFHTKLACVEKRIIQCSLQSGPITIDLDPRNQDWIAVDGVKPKGASREIHLNFCGDIGRFGAQSRCPSDSAICLIENGKTLSLGHQDLSGLGYSLANNSHIFQAVFTNGSPCTNGNISSRLTLVCALDSYTSSPVLVSQSDCIYNFEWRTPKACPSEPLQFDHCRFISKKSGTVVDLTPLHSDTNYRIQTTNHDYFINVCGPVVSSPCNRLGMMQARGCQVEKAGQSRTWNLGQNTSAFAFYDGEMINMTYTNGTPYNNPQKTTRSMSIVFVCDPTKGKGQPEFMGEENRAYGFLWRTSLVCPGARYAQECLAFDSRNNQQYDLSSLTRTLGDDDWTAVNPKQHGEKIYLNVCGALSQQNKCGRDSAVCLETIEQGNKIYKSLGRSMEMQTVAVGGRLSLKYTLGDECSSYGRQTNYSVDINFICAQNASLQNEGPKLLNILGGGCSYYFLWATKAACPVGNLEFQNCILTDPASGLTYDLNVLADKSGFYDIRGPGGRRFHMNICQKVSDAGCPNSIPPGYHSIAACELNSSGSTKEILGYFDADISSLTQEGHAHMTFIGHVQGKRKPKLELSLECDSEASVPEIEFLKEDDEGHFYFLVRTQVMCPIRRPNCNGVVDSNSNQYDLSSLTRVGNIFQASVGSKIKYFFSFCSGLAGFVGTACHNSGGCLVDSSTSDKINFSLGRQQQVPKAMSEGVVVFSFVEGSECSEGLNYTATVTMMCAPKQGPLVFISQTPECELMFTMETPTACPSKVITGENCQLPDYNLDPVLDLNSLRNKISDYAFRDTNDGIYQINICGPLVKPWFGCEGAAACLKNSDGVTGTSLGKPSSELTSSGPGITLTYKDGDATNCVGGTNRVTTVIFICKGEFPELHGRVMTMESESNCYQTAFFETELVCPSRFVLPCTASDNLGRFYDLSPLTKSNGMYEVLHPYNGNKMYFINVCSRLSQRDTMNYGCHPSSAACLYDKTLNSTLRYQNLGQATSPQFVDGTLTVIYSGGDLCPGNLHSEVKIEFQCDEDATDSKPELLFDEMCEHGFIWYTKYACPIQTQDTVSGNCSVTETQTGHVFNLSSLSSVGAISINTSLDHTFSLRVCAPLEASSCGQMSGSCQVEINGENKRNFSGGVANADLHYNQGTLYLNYSDGTPCHNGKFKRNTVIQFVCDSRNHHNEQKLVFIRESYSCSYLFEWYTPLACSDTRLITPSDQPEEPQDDKNFSCMVETKHGLVDLSVLSTPMTGDYLVFHDELPGIYTLAVCKQLKRTLLFFPNNASAGCYHCFDSGISQSLGQLYQPPYIDPEDRIVLEYNNGSTCPLDRTKQVSTQIFFQCNYNEKANVEVLGFVGDGCTFVFAFETSVVCPPLIETCAVGHKSKGFHFDLERLKGKIMNVTSSNDERFLINLCGSVATEGTCADSSVCLVGNGGNTSYGSTGNSSLYHNGAAMSYSFISNSVCPQDGSQKMKSEILFHCVPSAGLGQPILYKKLPCQAIFIWSTAEACLASQQPTCTLWINGSQFYDLRFLSSISHNWEVQDTDGNNYTMNLCRSLRQDPSTNNSCPSNSAVCYLDPALQKEISLGTAQTQKLEFDAVSGDVFLSYSGGSSMHCEGRSEEASTEIRFTCGSMIGNPRFVSRDSCKYKFEWKTHFACPNVSDRLMLEGKGILMDFSVPGGGFYINISRILSNSFIAIEDRRQENYTYVIQLGKGVSGTNINSLDCSRAAVCQVKGDGTFHRDIGSVVSRQFFIRGTELRAVLSSHGRKCGKNGFKNVTTIIKFQCSSAAGLGSPKFLYESGDCDYVFEWETSDVCFNFIQKKMSSSFFGGVAPEDGKHGSLRSLSTSTILGIVFGILFLVLILGILSSKERRSVLKSKTKSCFQRVRLPRYRYVQCYFLRVGSENDSHLLNSEGETVLLAQDDHAPVHDDSDDVDPIA